MKIRFLLLPVVLASLALVGCGSLNDPINPKEPWTPGGETASAAPVVDRNAPTRQPANPGFTPAPVQPAPVVPTPTDPLANPAPTPPTYNPPPIATAPPTAPSVDPLRASPADAGATLKGLPALGATTTLAAGELVTISFSDIANLLPIEQRIREDGNITLHFNVTVRAVGRTPGQLQEAIRAEYVPKYFNYLTVTVRTDERVYFVGGAVRSPNRYVYTGTKMTVSRAIDTAGGFTEFGDRKAVQLIRVNGQRTKINYDKAINDTKKDLEVFPGDRIHVPERGIFR